MERRQNREVIKLSENIDASAHEDKVQLVFSKGSPEVKRVLSAAPGQMAEGFVTSMSDLTEWFKNFNIESIELWLEGGFSEGGITKLLISFEGKGGCKVTLKPKQKT